MVVDTARRDCLLPSAAMPILIRFGQQGWPQGRWVLLDAAAACGPACEQRRFAMRQIHTAQGEAATRLVRRQQADVGLRQDGFYLVDPHGNGVLFYPDGAAPAAVIKEIRSVLKNNNSLG